MNLSNTHPCPHQRPHCSIPTNEFYLISIFIADDKDQKKSQKVLAELENIDDECDQNDIAFVKIDDDKEAEEWGIDEIPTIVSIVAICKVELN